MATKKKATKKPISKSTKKATKKKTTKKDIEAGKARSLQNIAKGKTTTVLDVERRVNYCLTEIRDNKSSSEIVKHLMKTHKIAESSAKKYLTKARVIIKDNLRDEAMSVKDDMLESLKQDMRDAKYEYQNTTDQKIATMWFRIYQECKKTIREFYPNLFEVVSDKSGGVTININQHNKKPFDMKIDLDGEVATLEEEDDE